MPSPPRRRRPAGPVKSVRPAADTAGMYSVAEVGSRAPAAAERGSALVWALFFVTLITGLMLSHSLEMQANRRGLTVDLAQRPLSRDFAQAALTDANAWFQRQLVQPVVQFAPQLDELADPPLHDTLDPELGLVREFHVRGNLWGRYEVRRDECLDVSAGHGLAAGSVWDVGARGILYQRDDPARPFDRAPNRVLAVQTLRTELRGLPVQTPAQSAVVVTAPARLQLGSDTRVSGGAGTPAVAVVSLLPPILAVPLGALLGFPSVQRLDPIDLSSTALFGMREDQLRALSDFVVADPRKLPAALQDQVLYVDKLLQLDVDRPLRGRALLYVAGDLVAQPGNGSDFSGLVIVQGNATLRGPFAFKGQMLVGGTLDAAGTADAPVVLAWDEPALQTLTQALSRYRKSSDVRPAGKNGAFTSASDYDAAAR